MNQSLNFLRNIPILLLSLRRISNGLPVGFSFNLADRCPIGCDCYWRAQARVSELSDDQVVSFFEAKAADGYNHVTVVGGEPYVRPKLLARVTPIIRTSWVVTSGTTPLQHLPRTTHFVSVDGADSETHNAVRKSSGLYERITRHLRDARLKGDFPVYIHTVLNAKNFRQIRAILSVWSSNGLADGVIFSTITPIRQGSDELLRLTRKQRIWIVEELVHAKEIFGKFLCMTPTMIRLLHPGVTVLRTPDNCGTARFIPSYDAAGNRMKQCILSDKADCAECGCVITSMLDTFAKKTVRGFVSGIQLLSKLIQN